jgi:hypothetical protein
MKIEFKLCGPKDKAGLLIVERSLLTILQGHRQLHALIIVQ